MIPRETIEHKIFLIRRQKIIISTHLAKLYQVETRVLIQAVKRNIERFPDDFMFSLTRAKIMNLSQFVISSKLKHAPNELMAPPKKPRKRIGFYKERKK